MSSLEDVYAGRRGRTRLVLRAVFLLLGGVVGFVGFASAAASLVAGFGYPAPVALALAGGLLPVAYLVLLARGRDADPHRPIAALALAVTAAGLAVFWIARPAGWSGDLGTLPPAAVGTYAAGLLAVFGSLVAPDGERADASARVDDGTLPSAGPATDRDETPSLAASADGGTDDDERTVFDE